MLLKMVSQFIYALLSALMVTATVVLFVSFTTFTFT